jgi:cytochrome d ubiquinol oxidase subunit I
VAAVFSLAQLYTGHRSAEGVAVNQPAKLAAFEGHFEASAPADMYIVGIVDKERQEVKGLKIPGGLSFLLHFDFDTPVTGLNAFPEDERPGQINAVFQFYHLMITIGLTMIGLSMLGLFLWMKGTLFSKRWLLTLFVFATFLPQIANQVGWFAAEMGRQPWVVYGLLKTSDAFSKSVTANQVLFSLILFTLIYVLLFVLFLYLLNKKIQTGPYDEQDSNERPIQHDITNALTRG